MVTGWDFVGDAFNADSTSATYNPVPVPDADPDDCNGHGSHVAGIVGASAASPGGVTGVAPGVTFGAYRVFGCEGSTTADIMIAAMERAYLDKMQVLNMSIGSSFQWPQYPTAVAASRLANKGVIVVASIGNSGANGLYAAGAPGLGDKVIGVASFDNTHVALTTFTISPDNTPIGYGPATGAPLPPTSGTYSMAVQVQLLPLQMLVLHYLLEVWQEKWRWCVVVVVRSTPKRAMPRLLALSLLCCTTTWLGALAQRSLVHLPSPSQWLPFQIVRVC